MARSIAPYCHVPLACGTCFDSSVSCARTAERIWNGQFLFGSDRRQQYYAVDCNMYCATWHVARDLANLLIANEQLVRIGQDRRRSTQASDGNVFLSISGRSRNCTWHVPLAHAIQLSEIASRAQAGSLIDTEKAAFHSSLRKVSDKTRGVSLCIK